MRRGHTFFEMSDKTTFSARLHPVLAQLPNSWTVGTDTADCSAGGAGTSLSEAEVEGLMEEKTRIGVHLRYKLLLEVGLQDESPEAGSLSEMIEKAVRACLGDLEIDESATGIAGFRVGKQVRLAEELIGKIDKAATHAGLERNEWFESAILAYYKQQKEGQ